MSSSRSAFIVSFRCCVVCLICLCALWFPAGCGVPFQVPDLGVEPRTAAIFRLKLPT